MVLRLDQERDGAPPVPVDSKAGTLGQIAADLFGCRDTHAVLHQVADAGRSWAGMDEALVLLYDAERRRFMPATLGIPISHEGGWLQRHGLAAIQELADGPSPRTVC